ncbi:MAG: hypothetical protein CTY39_02605 [Hyphomicrobium sp.]|nr:MAG: hypothetical protein CTY39_02605 [Hyphomicrobium sp.]
MDDSRQYSTNLDCEVVIFDSDTKRLTELRKNLNSEKIQVATCVITNKVNYTRQFRKARIIVMIDLPTHQAWKLTQLFRTSFPAAWILIFGAERDVDRIIGFELGADDVTPKIDDQEILTRILTRLRRDKRKYHRELYDFSGFLCDPDARTLISPAGGIVPMTARDFELLLAFARRPNRVITREQLLDICGIGNDVLDRVIDTCVSRLRRKLASAGAPHEMIITLRGVGYQFVPKILAAREKINTYYTFQSNSESNSY